MKLNYISLLSILISGLLFGCTKPEPNPQLQDFIYSQFKGELTIAEGLVEEKNKQIDAFESRLQESGLTDMERKSLKIKSDNAQHQIERLRQQVKYWQLKLLSREEAVRKQYLSAFNRGEKWDNSKETERYKKAIERLRKSKSKSEKTKTESKENHGGEPEQNGPSNSSKVEGGEE